MKQICTFKKPFTGHLFQTNDGKNIITYGDKYWEFVETELINVLKDVFKYACRKSKPSTIHVRKGPVVYIDCVFNWETEGAEKIDNIIHLFL